LYVANFFSMAGTNFMTVRYRYGVLIVFANYLIERRFGEASQDTTFPEWLSEHREITKLLGRRSLD
jgi:hypothetical protein